MNANTYFNQEFICDAQHTNKLNERWLAAKGLKCAQIYDSQHIYKSVEGEPINEEIFYKSGCNLRCLDNHCGNGPMEELKEKEMDQGDQEKVTKKTAELDRENKSKIEKTDGKDESERKCKNSLTSDYMCKIFVSYF